MRSFSPPFSDLWATRPACLQIWGPFCAYEPQIYNPSGQDFEIVKPERTMRSFSPPFSDLWATRPACLQFWRPILCSSDSTLRPFNPKAMWQSKA